MSNHRPNSRGFPSVTGIIADHGIIDTTWFDEQGRTRGQLVDAACGILAMGQEIDPAWLDRNSHLLPWIEPFAECLAGPLKGYRATTIQNEIVNETEKFCGHSDQEQEDELLVEVKTGTVPPWARLQTAAYTIGRRMKRLVVSLPGEGKYKLIEHSDPRDKDRFILLVRSWYVRQDFMKTEGI